MTSLNSLRTAYKPRIASGLSSFSSLYFEPVEKSLSLTEKIESFFPFLARSAHLTLSQGPIQSFKPIRVGVVFSGGQAPGGHNVITGLYDALTSAHKESELIGFFNGPSGILNNQTLLITKEMIDSYKNMGGFDLLGSGREKIELQSDLEKAKKTVLTLSLTGLVVIGGDDSNTNAAILSEYFLANGVNCSVIGVPKTIDGDLKGFGLET